jgi:hypothetical protein
MMDLEFPSAPFSKDADADRWWHPALRLTLTDDYPACFVFVPRHGATANAHSSRP